MEECKKCKIKLFECDVVEVNLIHQGRMRKLTYRCPKCFKLIEGFA